MSFPFDSFRPSLALVRKTEANIKRIEWLRGDFISYALNEWRYATHHLCLAVCDGSNDDMLKAEHHLQRAYYDSCDILVDCQLNKLAELELEFRGYVSSVAGLVDGFAEKCQCVYEAQRFRRMTVGIGDDKTKAYSRLEELADKLDGFIKELEATHPYWADEIRKQKFRDRLPIVLALAGIAVSIVLAVVF